MDIVKLVIGLTLLTFGGDFLVKGGSAIAKMFKVSSLVIGLTVVAFGTSAPELLVSLQAAIGGKPDIAVGNVIGSNIANIALILGLTAIFQPIPICRQSIIIDWPMMFISTVAFSLFAFDNNISRFEGIILAAALFACVFFQFAYSRKKMKKLSPDIKEEDEKQPALWLAILFVILSCFALAYGAKLLIEGASNIASKLGVSQRIIAVTVVALGTSLPELATSVIAAIKKESDIAIGNIIGSNMFNILCVIGFSAIFTPIKVSWSEFKVDYIWMLITSILLLVLILPIFKLIKERKHIEQCANKNGKFIVNNGKLGVGGGIILLATYIYYVVSVLL
ncbi:MAG: calcium/sodium antiporter [Bacteroidales bacterium]|nr:calcium/sodium antiporter [Bacteroidales bacterium]MDD2205609.1 calcium/sodium antiporter [Bacteroidales bacterium]MDD3153060.1 calcium/sodium antiporter [Bacteroidales bacterium]MDD3915003.1 calcium/sodium antiporter [Bacteroidales bacterium]MDD4633734.1 calcium/sodium antiporter [Bacteroidales bacterium]